MLATGGFADSNVREGNSRESDAGDSYANDGWQQAYQPSLSLNQHEHSQGMTWIAD